MNTLVLALYTEGRTDERFLTVVSQRAAEQLLIDRGRTLISVLDPIVLKPSKPVPESREEKIINVARQAAGFYVLVVHSDADHRKPDKALRERILPGIQRVRNVQERACKNLVPIIPVQMTEAWMLVDPQALKKVIVTDLSIQALAIPQPPKKVELISNPKQTLQRILQIAVGERQSRRRQIKLGMLYEPLASRMDLTRLKLVPAYQQFNADLKNAFTELNLI